MRIVKRLACVLLSTFLITSGHVLGQSSNEGDALREWRSGEQTAGGQIAGGTTTSLPGIVDSAVDVGFTLASQVVRTLAGISFMLGALRLLYFVFLPAGAGVGLSAVRYLLFHFIVVGTLFFIMLNVPSWLSDIAGLGGGKFSSAALAPRLKSAISVDLKGFAFIFDIVAVVAVAIAYFIIIRDSIKLSIALLGQGLELPYYEQYYVEFIKQIVSVLLIFYMIFQVVPEVVKYINGLGIT